MQDDSDEFAVDPDQPHTHPTTGDPRVDEAVARLGRLDGLPLDEHVELYADLHDELRRVLSELDEQGQPGGPGPAGR